MEHRDWPARLLVAGGIRGGHGRGDGEDGGRRIGSEIRRKISQLSQQGPTVVAETSLVGQTHHRFAAITPSWVEARVPDTSSPSANLSTLRLSAGDRGEGRQDGT